MGPKTDKSINILMSQDFQEMVSEVFAGENVDVLELETIAITGDELYCGLIAWVAKKKRGKSR